MQLQLMALLAYFYLQNGRPEKASALLQALEILDPGQPRVLGNLVLAQLRSGDAKHALETLDRLAMHGDIDAAFYLMRTFALTSLHRDEEASEAMSHYINLRHPQLDESLPAGRDKPRSTSARSLIGILSA